MTEKTFSEKEVQEMIMRERSVNCLNTAIQRAVQYGDPKEYVDTLVYLRALVSAPAVKPVEEENKPEPVTPA
jgi:hypothetical protein